MIIRHARDSDAEQFESFDLGDSGLWLDEVAEIVAGLVAWRADPLAEQRDRQVIVIVAVADSQIVGVTAHERLGRSGGRVWNDHRYLMVTAVRSDQQRTGLARLLVESVLADLGSRGVSRWSGWCIRRIVRRSSSAGTCSPKPTKHSRPRTTRT